MFVEWNLVLDWLAGIQCHRNENDINLYTLSIKINDWHAMKISSSFGSSVALPFDAMHWLIKSIILLILFILNAIILNAIINFINVWINYKMLSLWVMGYGHCDYWWKITYNMLMQAIHFFFCNDCNCHTAMNFKDKHLIVWMNCQQF